MFNITRIKVGALETNCYVIWTKALDALIIDPGADAGAISKIISHCRLIVRGYLITHGHIDHVGALEPLWQQIKAPIAMHAADVEWAFSPANQMPPCFAAARRPAHIERVLKGGEKWAEEGFSYQVIHTPGHSPGSVCFYFPEENPPQSRLGRDELAARRSGRSAGILFSGDTLFQGGVGRIDLPGGNAQQLSATLKVLAKLPPETKVYPGHGAETTIGREINSIFFLRRGQKPLE